MSNLTVASVNGSAVVEYRAVAGHPAPHQITIQRRTLTRSGNEYRSSAWRTMIAGDVRMELRRNGPMAEWLRTQTCVDLRSVRLANYSDEEPAHLFSRIPTLNERHSTAAYNARRRVTRRASAVVS